MASELPFARGVGSSAAAIVAGIEIANILCGLQLSIQDKLNLASQFEGHPDNATASVLGGLTISSMDEEGNVDTIHIHDLDASFVLFIPNVKLKTSEARNVLPQTLERPYAVRASARANMLVAALVLKDYERIGKYMESDLFHEPFRADLIPYYHEIRREAKKAGAFGTALSGAGPTMISIIPNSIGPQFVAKMEELFPAHKIILTKPDQRGVHVEEISSVSKAK